MKDLRIKDNKALSLASETAVKYNKNLIILHVLSPGDYKAHDRAPCRIDFVLRSLRHLQEELDTFNIPLAIRTITPRLSIPQEVLGMAKEWKSDFIFANLEYEVDELRRDIKLCELAQGDGSVECNFSHDYVVVKPGDVKTKVRRSLPFATEPSPPPFSLTPTACSCPSPIANSKTSLIQCSRRSTAHGRVSSRKTCKSTRRSIRYPRRTTTQSAKTGCSPSSLKTRYPSALKVSSCRRRSTRRGSTASGPLGPMQPKRSVRPLVRSSTLSCPFMCCLRLPQPQQQMLRRFMKTKARSGYFAESPLAPGATEDPKNSRVAKYSTGRSEPYIDGGSRLSPFLAAGVISVRACLRAILEENKNGKLPMTRDTGLGSWTQEICFRDFYQHVMVAWPRVSMGRNFILKYEDVKWDDDPDGEKLKAWEEGVGLLQICRTLVRRWTDCHPLLVCS